MQQTTQVLQEKAAPILAFQSFPAAPQASDDDSLHSLRINVKKCRYSLEILNPLHGSRFEKGIELAKELQEILGKIHDLAVLIGRLNTHVIHLMEKARSHLATGCQRIVGNLGELKQSLVPQVEPAYKAFVDELCQLLPLETKSAGLDPSRLKMEKSSQETLNMERRNAATLPAERAADLLTSTQSSNRETARVNAGGGTTKLNRQ